MCGIVGIFSLNSQNIVEKHQLQQMLGMIRHRGPDEFGIYLDTWVGLGSARLSIIDLNNGQQPIANEDNTCWIVFNGEIFNYLELRKDLESLGHHFTTQSDTEIIIHLYEEYSANCLHYLNGQFAFAIWDSRKQQLFCARDRFGIRPLFYTLRDNNLIFGSEIKSLISHPLISPEIDPYSLHEVFTFWTTLSPKTIFKDIFEIPPGHYLIANKDGIHIERYWELEFNTNPDQVITKKVVQNYVEELSDLLIDAVQIRLRSDVPVGAYLSGGLDSSLIASIICNHTTNQTDTFSITFDDIAFDESDYQQQMVDHLNIEHHKVNTNSEIIGEVFPDIIWHTEIPILRTSPAPMYLLSKLVKDHNYKVVVTGEGADEFFGGYNIFKETMIRLFWSKQPESNLRPLLLRKLYPYLQNSSRNTQFFKAFFKQHLSDTHLNSYSHILRWENTSRLKHFFSDNVKTLYQTDQLDAQIQYPSNFSGLHSLEKAQYLESNIFMSQYLLSSQGDRMGMANSVEGRYPFLDHRIVQFANQLPPSLKLRNLTEKYLLKQLGSKSLPQDIWERDKHPYRSPISKSFFHENTPSYVDELLSPVNLKNSGLFNENSTSKLVKKLRRGRSSVSEIDNMALAGILSTQILYNKFIQNFQMRPPISDQDNIKIAYQQTYS